MTNPHNVDENRSEASGKRRADAGKYLTFRLAAEEYGLEILKVREIIGLMAITKVPRTPQYVRGVINLRGKVIPVMDLRLKFSMPAAEDTRQTCVVVVDVSNGDESVMTGIVVDSVSEVLDIVEDQIEDAPTFGTGIDTEYILGIGKIKDEVKILLDIDKVLDSTSMSMVFDDNVIEEVEEVPEELLEAAGA